MVTFDSRTSGNPVSGACTSGPVEKGFLRSVNFESVQSVTWDQAGEKTRGHHFLQLIGFDLGEKIETGFFYRKLVLWYIRKLGWLQHRQHITAKNLTAFLSSINTVSLRVPTATFVTDGDELNPVPFFISWNWRWKPLADFSRRAQDSKFFSPRKYESWNRNGKVGNGSAAFSA